MPSIPSPFRRDGALPGRYDAPPSSGRADEVSGKLTFRAVGALRSKVSLPAYRPASLSAKSATVLA